MNKFPQRLFSLNIAVLNSALNKPYIKGLIAELPYPVHNMISYNHPGVISSNNAVTGIQIKKGSQQMINTPTTIPRVLAAPDSRS